MRVGLGSDQLGFECKEHLKKRFAQQGHIAEDVSTGNPIGDDCRSVTDQLALAIRTRRVERAILICARAIGASVMANKHPEVRAAVCHDLNSARLGVEDSA